jgi:hypothetical protein
LEEEGVCGFGGIEDTLDIVAVFEVDRCELGGWVVCLLCGEGCGLDDGSSGQV